VYRLGARAGNGGGRLHRIGGVAVDLMFFSSSRRVVGVLLPHVCPLPMHAVEVEGLLRWLRYLAREMCLKKKGDRSKQD
jgi:hypothetical protein